MTKRRQNIYILTLIILAININISKGLFQYKVHSKKLHQVPHGNSHQEFANNLKNLAISAHQPDGYCTKIQPNFPLNNQNMCDHCAYRGTSTDIYWIIEIQFSLQKDTKFWFQFGVDFGLGSAIFINDQFHKAVKHDLWWGGQSFGNHGVLQFDYNFKKGCNTIQVYGAEHCCDGLMDIRYMLDGDQQWKKFTSSNLNCETAETHYAQNLVETRKLPHNIKLDNEGIGHELVYKFETAEQPQGYCNVKDPVWPVSNQKSCGGGAWDILYLYEIQFDLISPAWLEFQFGVDFGVGHAVFVDDIYYSYSPDDLWWGLNFHHTNEIVTVKGDYSAGKHTLKVYGRERCCDGDQSVRFKVGMHGHHHTLNRNNFQSQIPGSQLDMIFSTKKMTNPHHISDALKPSQFKRVFQTSDQPQGYCTKENAQFPVENSSLCHYGSNIDIIWKIEFSFKETEQADYQFQFGSDMGLGVIIYINGKVVINRSDDLWWYHNWNANNEIVNFSLTTSPNYQNKIEIYGAEKCCDGLQDIRFSKNGAPFISINQLQSGIKSLECSQDYQYAI